MTEKGEGIQKVHIKFERLQTWLFAVPRLRAMVGANTLLGEVARNKLRTRACEQGKGWKLEPITGSFPALDLEDPLNGVDDPAEDLEEGILSRDGGHFEAYFREGAKTFADHAATLLRNELPGLRFSVLIDKVKMTQARAALSAELPVLTRCQWAGHGIASVQARQGEDRPWTSLEVSARHAAAKRAEDESARDLATLLLKETKKQNLKRPKTFQQLVGNGYMAVIHADGNDIGGSAPKVDEKQPAEGELKRAAFYHRNRVLIRKALLAALDRTFESQEKPNASEKTRYMPALPLMVGGDDVLVVTRADVALKFVAKLCSELETLQSTRGDLFHLTLGIGVVIAPHTVPFHRLHQVAETLASSAKVEYRALETNPKVSLVDWAVYTTAWTDDPTDIRRRDWIRTNGQEKRILSQRPLKVVGEKLDSLQALLRASDKMKDAPRSQLLHLVDQLRRGKHLAELALLESSSETRKALADAGFKTNEQLWSPTGTPNMVTTSLLDLVEIYEIGQLGRGDQEEEVRGRVTATALEADEHEGDEDSDDNREEMAQ